MSNPTRVAIQNAISQVLAQTGRSIGEFHDEVVLGQDLKLDSLDLAQVVVQLEAELGIDPFRTGSRAVVTLGDLVNLYSDANEG